MISFVSVPLYASMNSVNTAGVLSGFPGSTSLTCKNLHNPLLYSRVLRSPCGRGSFIAHTLLIPLSPRSHCPLDFPLSPFGCGNLGLRLGWWGSHPKGEGER